MWNIIIPVALFSIIAVSLGTVLYTLYSILEELKK